MLNKLVRLSLVPLTLAMASTALLTPPSGAVTGPNIVEDFDHEYVGLVAFYDEEGQFLHRCTGPCSRPRSSSPPGTAWPLTTRATSRPPPGSGSSRTRAPTSTR